MRNYKYILAIVLSCAVLSCNEEEWLEETVYDFYSVSNSYTRPEQFNAAVAYLYQQLRIQMIESAHTGYVIFFYTTDIAYDTNNPTHELNSYKDAVIPQNARIKGFWDNYYKIIASANVIIGRIDDPSIPFTSESQRRSLKAEALFFRAYIYRNLGIQFGDVPLVTAEVDKPKRDFVRASRAEVWKQCIEDLEYAAENLPDVTELKEDGRLTKGAANHLLAEMYIITQEWDKAIAAASKVIDNPAYALMTSRFGRWKDKEGDVYGDLFRRNNQNRSSGNTESIWVSQYEYNVTGGGGLNLLTRFLVPIYWSLTGDSDNVSLFVGSTVQNGGRGIGWMAASDYLLYDVWDDPNDMRNSEYNIIRDLVADNPASAYYGQKIVESGAITNFPQPYKGAWTAIFAKSTPINDFPAEVIADPETGVTTSGANGTFTDTYMMRLAETYLLRAEAYLGKGDKDKAAADINVVRARVNASQISAADVDLDFILDERARELHFEEFRLLTLMRTGKLVERVRQYNPMANFTYNTSETIFDYHNVWPIPESAIETNAEAELKQNPGYH